jgi:hypothetical protein
MLGHLSFLQASHPMSLCALARFLGGTNSGLGFPWFSARIISIRANIVGPLRFTSSIRASMTSSQCG